MPHAIRLFPYLILALLLGSCGGRRDNGEAIFFTGLNDRGTAIASDIDRTDLRDKSMVIACASCHGEDRLGRRNPIPDLGPFSTPDISPATLSQPVEGRRPAYTRELLANALLNGRGANGRGLHYPMPRWKLDEKDLGDLTRFLLRK
ncbi:MAG: hypothetical protein IPP94_10715 [Ignavibacteria bacterium]|nr:hypothetical protein [Ignavibacteria bacterium]